MAGPYDAVVTIGGQSLIDGLWRLLGPALERLNGPLPIALPGFSNAQLRITNLVPVYPSTGTGLALKATIDLTAEALLRITGSTGALQIDLANLTGTVDTPQHNEQLTDPSLPATVLGNLGVPQTTATLTGTASGTLGSLQHPNIPGLPIPMIVPVAVDLTPQNPLWLQAVVQFAVSGPSAATRFGLLFHTKSVSVGGLVGLDANLATTLATQFSNVILQLVAQLDTPIGLATPTLNQPVINALIGPIPRLVGQTIDEALTLLFAETGRLVFPPPGAGASCEVKALPTSADAQLTISPTAGYALQIGFARPGSGDIPGFPPISSTIVESRIQVGNGFVLDLLCCLVERLPTFVLPAHATLSNVDVAGHGHLRCCNFTGVTAAFGPVVVGGGAGDGISVCIDGQSGHAKSFSLVGKFRQAVPNPLTAIPNIPGIVASLVPNIATITVDFTLPIGFDFDDLTALANLRINNPPAVSVQVWPSIWLTLLVSVIAALGAVSLGALGGIVAGVMAPIAGVIVLLLLYLACGAVSFLLSNAVKMALAGASLVRSPVAVPPGLLEAFGRVSPASVTVDDLDAAGVLHTPTSLWGVLPRIGPGDRETPPPPPWKDEPTPHTPPKL